MFGLELMRRPSDEYYEELPSRIGSRLTVSLSRSILTVPAKVFVL